MGGRMTLQQKRRVFARANPGIFVILPDGRILWRDTLGLIIEREWLYAVHLAEETLKTWQHRTYGEHLANGTEGVRNQIVQLYHAAESQRIDAFLKVKGLWREGE
jgi:hypothetical protein